MDLNPIVLSIPIYFLLIGVELLIQQFNKERLYRLNDAVTNISCGILQQVTGLIFKVLTVAAYQFVYSYFALFQIEPTWYNLIILFILVDLCYYWAHRMSHEVNLFWGGHVVHHQSEDYNFSVALRQGSFQVVWTFAFYLPLAVIGFDTLSMVTMSALVTVYQFWIHTEKINRMGWLEKVFNTPSHHRVHHGRNPKYIDKNHAGVFIIWDKMFGTFQKEEERPVYGITTPVATWNPLYANLKHYHDMSRQLIHAKKWSHKMGILFKKPGWLPETDSYLAIPEVDRNTIQKYDVKGTSAINFYVLFQYVLILAGTATFLFTEGNTSWLNKIAAILLISAGILTCGGLFERKKWVLVLEFFRHPVTTAFVIYLFTGSQAQTIVITMLVTTSLISIIWLFYLKRHFRFLPEYKSPVAV
ncbi:sterol desaturase family protein [Roseivirga sp. BDSF3-8]|uniref:sterol desaturase family protein n=1 Tax=Roseivirga sp. BDSF3-8 TaxID=3241598 RepID=UPI003531E0B6